MYKPQLLDKNVANRQERTVKKYLCMPSGVYGSDSLNFPICQVFPLPP
jgi:hypothetical protein